MLKSVKLKTELVEGSRDASTVDAISPALVESDEGKGGARTGEGILADEIDSVSAGRVTPSGSVWDRVRGGGCAPLEFLLGVRLR
jgi:hypothetical protein